ncbi:methylmalonyl-CoA mutase family protein [Mucilaginibacter gotjawali]|uniref:Methylmalonyl-CoA mutase cobalamin-binding domain/chain n=2 Tax=Mucilaginibacter gotjawali TaxID=1550579 RepID=A0A839SI55_9SPHI|nr:methylmalonyl-CoA mutase family protein [Mucilaginibacter gotjawali]MBB3056964.1 methylmalonyl-CoA mutase cobalamin-binding domain/chain [Mucilaginibacter gotjawali]BAU56043.1 Methylmalonyl-CoA mutase [Mucilaginibacter gotjawali]
MESIAPYHSTYKIRFVTAASLFDGHDATINIMRRILQSSGAEVIHLGHNRSVEEVVNCAIQEDVQGIALTSYQGGHLEYFKYMHDLLKERGAGHIKIFGGGGGVFLPHEIEELQAYGITRIYSPDDGRKMGLQGMINDMLQQCDFQHKIKLNGELKHLPEKDIKSIATAISIVENYPKEADNFLSEVHKLISTNHTPVLGITGTGGSGKSSLVDEIVRRFLMETDKTLAIISVDPSKRKTGGALLGDRIRMNAINSPRVYMRSLATRQANLALSKHVQESIDICKAAGYDFIIVETSGIGQSDTMITDYCDLSLYVMTPEFGAATQLEKIDMLDFADIVALNKFDKRGALDAIRDVRKQYKRNHHLFDAKDEDIPVYGTMASQFNDPGMNTLFEALMKAIKVKTGADFIDAKHIAHLHTGESEKIYIIPPDRNRYLAEIVESSVEYKRWVNEQCKIAQQLYQVQGTIELVGAQNFAPLTGQSETHNVWAQNFAPLREIQKHLEDHLHPECKRLLKQWPETIKQYTAENFIYKVRDKEIKQPLYYTSLSQLQVPKIALPKYEAWGDILRWLLTENLPGEFPYTAGVFPLKREGEDPTRMFAGEGGPERTNKRFHYVSLGQPAHRLSTAFDSVTLYGEDPHTRPDIYGKIGNSGVSIATLDDAKKLYSGFDLCSASTSVSMTINGPAPMLLGFFMNAAIDQQCEKYIKEHQLEHLVEAKFKELYDDKGLSRPAYRLTQTLSKGEGLKSLTPAISKGEGDKRLGFMTGDLRIWETLKANSRENRQNQTPAENILWQLLRNNQTGYKIRRQHAIDGYIADFVCLPKGLVIEVDGGYHEATKEEDDIRTKVLNNEGFKVIRFTNEEIANNTTRVIQIIKETLFNQPDRKVLSFGEDLGEAKISGGKGPKEIEEDQKVLSFGEDLGEASALPPGNDGLGLLLLGLTGDQVLPADVYAKIKAKAIATVRGTVQADILKEDQAQNTCIFSTEFALRMMGDIQQYFIDQKVRNFYSVSISGYHIAEAGANPITQLAFTLSNGFTYVEYYLSRGMHIDDFAPNLSFFFSNGIDPEYAVIGRVARRIWAKAIKNKYKGNDRSQKLKYHIQTSGRSLHAQEIDFNDIRTTLQALYAIYDNCNSLHTNAYDEAITTPTEESVRRAMAIQLIINRELGLAKNENPIQGAFIIEELTDLVEEAVLAEFKAINDRGGVLGAMETMYQRSKIQEESLYYETLKHTGEYPIVGVNTFLNKNGSPTIVPSEVIRATEEEKQFQIEALHEFQHRNEDRIPQLLKTLQQTAIAGGNIFESLMEACKYCSLGQISHALYEVGGQYRRNM